MLHFLIYLETFRYFLPYGGFKSISKWFLGCCGFFFLHYLLFTSAKIVSLIKTSYYLDVSYYSKIWGIVSIPQIIQDISSTHRICSKWWAMVIAMLTSANTTSKDFSSRLNFICWQTIMWPKCQGQTIYKIMQDTKHIANTVKSNYQCNIENTLYFLIRCSWYNLGHMWEVSKL